MLVRLQKFLADAGVASRRHCERLILDGNVAVNGRTVQLLGTKVDPDEDSVTVDRVKVKPKKKLYVALHKPPGYICSRFDPMERPSATDLLPLEWKNLYSVGRLDFRSEGLIFFTNDGDFSLKLTHPRFGVAKKYLVTVKGSIDSSLIQRTVTGVFVDGEKLKADKARILRTKPSHSLVEVILGEGKNREIRRMFEALGVEVERLQRVQIGPIKLAELPKGKWRTLTETEIKSLLSNASQADPRKEV